MFNYSHDCQGCTEIKSFLDLKEVLEELPARVESLDMCHYLGIKMCDELSRDSTLKPRTIAEEYCRLKTGPCWEDIVQHLCQDFRDNRLAKKTADAHNIFYHEYCSEF